MRKALSYWLRVMCYGGLAAFALARPVHAGSSILSLDPTTRTVNTGDIFNLTIKLNTGGDSVNTVTSILSFDKTLLKVVSADSSGSAFPIEFESQFDNANGQYRSTRAVPRPGVNGSDILVLKVNFEAVGQGTAAVGFTDTSATYRNNDLQDNLQTKTGSTVTINATGTVTPTPTTGPGTPTPTWPPGVPTPTPPSVTPSPTASQSPTPSPRQSPTPGDNGGPTATPSNPDLPDGAVAWPTLVTLSAGFSLILSGSKLLRILK